MVVMNPSQDSLLRLAMVAASFAFTAVPTAAQCTEASVPGQPYEGFGRSLAPAGDVDADGRPDVLVYARAGTITGAYVEVRSGRDASVLHRIDWSVFQIVAPGIDGAGDLDGDGHDDFLVGEPSATLGGVPSAGRVRAYSGATGAVLLEVTGSDYFGYFGAAAAGLGDVDGDGTPDFAVGEPGNNQNGGQNGAVHLYSGATGTLLGSRFGNLRDNFGAQLDGGGDVDADGIPDVLVGAPREDGAEVNQGGAWALSGVDLAPIRHVVGWAQDDAMGTAVASVGDWDGDGHADFAAGAPAAFGSGVVLVVSGRTGQNLAWLNAGLGASGYGAVLAAGDFDGDTALELAVGIPSANTAGPSAGAVNVYDGPYGVLRSGFSATASYAFFGSALALPGDLDGDGRGDLVVGAPGSDAGGPQSGEVLAYLCGRMTLLPPAPGVAGQPNQFQVTGAQPGSPLAFHVSQALGGSPLPGCAGATLDLGTPRATFATAVADASGDARVTLTVPAALHGTAVALQAADTAACTTTPPILAVFF
jgi:hypothetical protein